MISENNITYFTSIWVECNCIRDISNSSALLWLHNGRNGVWNHQPHHCLLSRLFNRRSKKTSKLHVTGICAGNSPVTGEFPAQRASNAENVSIWWRHNEIVILTSDTHTLLTEPTLHGAMLPIISIHFHWGHLSSSTGCVGHHISHTMLKICSQRYHS